MLTEVQEFNAVMNALGTGTSVLPSVVVSLGTGSKPTEQVEISYCNPTANYLH